MRSRAAVLRYSLVCGPGSVGPGVPLYVTGRVTRAIQMALRPVL